MMGVSFNEAFAAARGSSSDEQWFCLTPRERSEAIYREMRLMDAETARQHTPQRKPQRTGRELPRAA
jgi:hypothetical protein